MGLFKQRSVQSLRPIWGEEMQGAYVVTKEAATAKEKKKISKKFPLSQPPAYPHTTIAKTGANTTRPESDRQRRRAAREESARINEAKREYMTACRLYFDRQRAARDIRSWSLRNGAAVCDALAVLDFVRRNPAGSGSSSRSSSSSSSSRGTTNVDDTVVGQLRHANAVVATAEVLNRSTAAIAGAAREAREVVVPAIAAACLMEPVPAFCDALEAERGRVLEEAEQLDVLLADTERAQRGLPSSSLLKKRKFWSWET